MKNKKVIEEIKEEVKPTKESGKKIYIGYKTRVAFFLLLSFVFVGFSVFSLVNLLNMDDETIISYQEKGDIDYKVYLKENNFYEQDYLDQDMVYIASLIDNIDLNVDYNFIINEETEMEFVYDIVGKLSIYDEEKNSVLYEKEYILLEEQTNYFEESREHTISEKITIDYDYYNSLANSFKATYGVDSESNLKIYARIKKNVSSITLDETNQMSLNIPLTEKTIDITMSDEGINAIKSIIEKENLNQEGIGYIISFVVSLLLGLVAIIKLMKYVLLLFPNYSKYDKYLKRILTEYDRLIVETPTAPNFTDKKVIKIKSFDELLDVRDNLKRPIMYYELAKHHKSYFYVEQYPDCYLFVLKANDLEVKNEK